MIDILIPVYNKSYLTIQCLQDYSNLDKNNHKITIFNNGSKDNTLEKVNEFIKSNTNVNIIDSKENLGFAISCNEMFKNTKEEIVIFSNNDIRCIKSGVNDWTKTIVDALEDDLLLSPTAGLIDNKFNFVYETQDKNKLWNYLSGWLLCGKRKTFEKFAGYGEYPFTEDMTTYFEDTWLSFRAKQIGIKMQLVKVPIIHLGKQTSKDMNVGQMYTKARNIFINKCRKEGVFP